MNQPASSPAFLDHHTFYLVGIKGVAMTSLAQCLLDTNKAVRGSDIAEEFVTQPILDQRGLVVEDFSSDLFDPDKPSPECLVYTSAHQAGHHPQVQAALKAGLPIYSQAEALAALFNQKQGIAVCGVGGKSTTSAMLAWIFSQLKLDIAFSVGVGEILGMSETGAWSKTSQWMIAEADEYVIDPNVAKEQLQPRFSFLKPLITVCTNLKFDHPDVYANFASTKAQFKKFFLQIKKHGYLIVNADDQDLLSLAQEVIQERADLQLLTFSWNNSQANYYFQDWRVEASRTQATVLTAQGQSQALSLQVPGQFNAMNALAALAATQAANLKLADACQALASFQSTKRRFELVKISQGRRFFDDYAHHPSELSELIRTLHQYFPQQKRIIAFQPHTYSRTKALFNDFVEALGSNLESSDQLILIDIFASAREQLDDTVSSQQLAQAINDKFPQAQALWLANTHDLAQYLQAHNFDLAITVGAGDIYKLWQELA